VTLHLSFLLVELPVSVPELPLSSGQRVTLKVQELPLSFGQRVTFFAGAKKVTKETPSRSEPSQEEPLGLREGCADSHAQLGFLGLLFPPLSGCRAATESEARSAFYESGPVNLRRRNRPWNSSRDRRFALRQTWARSDSERCFFGDFLCTSKESYPLLRRRSGSSCFPRNSVSEHEEQTLRKDMLLRRRSGSSCFPRNSVSEHEEQTLREDMLLRRRSGSSGSPGNPASLGGERSVRRETAGGTPP